MAEAIKFPSANDVLKAPPGFEEQVGDLHIYRGSQVHRADESLPDAPLHSLPDGGLGIELPVLASCWQLTPEELAQVNRNGGKIYGVFVAVTHPPFYIAVNPFNDEPTD